MKPFLIINFFAICFISLIISCQQYPDELILGTWIEEEWISDDHMVENLAQKEDHVLKKHQKEKWLFTSNKQFEIHKVGSETIYGSWRILGRGHILELFYPNGETEVFDIKELNDNELLVNADIGLEIQGVSKFYFKRLND